MGGKKSNQTKKNQTLFQKDGLDFNIVLGRDIQGAVKNYFPRVNGLNTLSVTGSGRDEA